jgi:exoribonuclease R
MPYRITILDRTYTKWSVECTQSGDVMKVGADFDPFQDRLFDGDIFESLGRTPNIVDSKVRRSLIPGVLVLRGNRMLGRPPGKRRGNRFYYKCIPNNRRLPAFLVPCGIKLGFNKHIPNRFVVFRFDRWEDKHPCGILHETLGSVNDFESFCAYQLQCRDLRIAPKEMKRLVVPRFKKQEERDPFLALMWKSSLENRCNYRVITIDPAGSKDLDDAFSITSIPTGDTRISIYISHVPLWLDMLDLWQHVPTRSSTIYLPNRKVGMLPNILADDMFSLLNGKVRPTLFLDLVFGPDGVIKTSTFGQALIYVNTNYVYDSANLDDDPTYKRAFALLKGRRDISGSESMQVKNSHDLIQYLMIQMNRCAGTVLSQYHCGVYRCFEGKGSNLSPTHPGLKKFLRGWGGKGSYSDISNNSGHSILGLTAYAQVTSPIRRQVDIINILALSSKLGLYNYTPKAVGFYAERTSAFALTRLNMEAKAIAKVQKECQLLHACLIRENDDSEHVREGLVFEKTLDDALWCYLVYVPSLSIVVECRSPVELECGSKNLFKFHIILDEDRLKQKVKLELVNNCT